jgi:hypothetical protein
MNTIQAGIRWLTGMLERKFATRLRRREVIHRPLEVQLEFPWLRKR